MVDEIPYIYVDNRRIAPIQRPSKPATPPAAPAEPAAGQERPFGIVDRVTISTQAREQMRRDAARTDTPAADQAPMLTYSPRQLMDR